MKKTVFAFCGIFLCAMMLGPVVSAFAAPLKIGVFDIQEIMKTSNATRSYAEALQKDIKAKRDALKEKAAELKQMEDKLKNSKDMSAEDRENLSDKIVIGASDLKHDEQDTSMEIKQMNQNLTQKALSQIGGIITRIAKKGKYSIILEKRAAGVVYFTKKMDITPEIISIYNTMQKNK